MTIPLERGIEPVHNQPIVALPSKKFKVNNEHLIIQKFGRAWARPIDEVLKTIGYNDVKQLIFPNQIVLFSELKGEGLVKRKNGRDGNQAIEEP